ncbi:MAG: molybdopterin-dependent oxidoreductase [Thermodesulfovibrionales bacterium]|jgi:DMSO/TMAO reductase YedYZ molybdopterin-dependent catalytic subunit
MEMAESMKQETVFFEQRYAGQGISIAGAVKNPHRLTAEDLKRMAMTEVRDLLMVCSSGDPKGMVGSYRGVLLEDLLNRAEVILSDHHAGNRICIVARSTDGYIVVFSWNELSNSSVGEGVLVIVEKNGQPLNDDEGPVALVSAGDILTGSRHMKWLSRIEVMEIPSVIPDEKGCAFLD